MSFVLAIIVIGVGLAVFFMARRQAATANVVWRDAAGRLDLLFEKGGLMHDRKITGRRNGLTVKVDTYAKGSGRNNTLYSRIVVEGEGRIPPSLDLRREDSWLAVKKFFKGEDIQVGDEAFDQLVHVKGRELDVLPALNKRAREQVMSLVERGGWVAGGSVTYEEKGLFTSVGQITVLVDDLTAVAQVLAMPASELRSAMSFNVTQDPLPAVRQRNLRLLLKHFARSEQANHAVSAALGDGDPAVRFLAAQHAGEAGTETLVSVFQDPAATAEMRTQALNRLVAARGDQSVRPFIEQGLGDPSSSVRTSAIRAIGVTQDTSFFEQLVGRLKVAEPGLQAVITDVLGRTGDPRAEEPLVEMLASPEVDVQVAAARSLGMVGTVRSVEPLLPFTKGILADARMKDVARGAIASIQGRLSGAEIGGLSVADAEDEVGALSVAES